MVAIIAIEMNLKIKRDFFLNNNLYDVELYPTLINEYNIFEFIRWIGHSTQKAKFLGWMHENPKLSPPNNWYQSH